MRAAPGRDACGRRGRDRFPPTADALAEAMQGHRVVILGEVHDNGAQHALRAAALRKLVQQGARPAIAFEQFDRERQEAIDRARRERPRDADYLIAQAKGAPSWKWELYKPFIALALEYDLPIVAANLSRAEAMKVATGASSSSPLDVPPSFLRAHEDADRQGSLQPAARGSAARHGARADRARPVARPGDRPLCRTRRRASDGQRPCPHRHRRAALAAPAARAAAISIALLERDAEGASSEPVAHFDAYVVTEPAPRPDPCEDLRRRMSPRRK